MTSWRPGNYRVANPQSGPIYPIGFCPLSAPPVISIWFLPYLTVYFISSPIFPILASAASLFYMTLPTFFFVVYSPTRHHLPSCFYLSLCWSSSSLMFASFLSLSLPLLFISSILVMYICDVHYYIILSYEGLYHIGNKLKPCYSLVYSLYWNIYGLSV